MDEQVKRAEQLAILNGTMRILRHKLESYNDHMLVQIDSGSLTSAQRLKLIDIENEIHKSLRGLRATLLTE